MNRQIKFRAWSSMFQKFLATGFHIIGETTLFDLLNQHRLEELDFLTIQQFAGSSDRNKKEIYEGDIVLWDNPDPYDDENKLTKIVGYNSRAMQFRLYGFPEQVSKAAGASFFPENAEVIGNIFEGAQKDGIDYGKWRMVV